MIENDEDENEKIHPFSNDILNQNLTEINVNEELLMKKPGLCSNFFYFIFPCLKKVDTQKRRCVLFRNSERNVTFYPNKEENHKYSILFFIPVVLFNQFKQFGNFFYLLLSISQFFPSLQVGFLFTYISPLGIVVGFSMLKELYDDIKRRKNFIFISRQKKFNKNRQKSCRITNRRYYRIKKRQSRPC